MTECKTIRLGLIVGVIGCNQTTGAGHIIDNDRRVSWKVLTEVTCNRACVGIETAPRREADYHSDGFTLEVRLLSSDARIPDHQQTCDQKSLLHPHTS